MVVKSILGRSRHGTATGTIAIEFEANLMLWETPILLMKKDTPSITSASAISRPTSQSALITMATLF